MKKFYLLLIAILLCAFLVSCDGADEEYVIITDENGETIQVKKDETDTDSDSSTNGDALGDIQIEVDGGTDTGTGSDNNWTANY